MKGIERITDRIGADVQAEIDGVMGKAQAKADEIRQGYEAQAAKARTEAQPEGRGGPGGPSCGRGGDGPAQAAALRQAGDGGQGF